MAQDCATFYEMLGFVRVQPPAALAARAIWVRSGETALHFQFAGTDGAAVEAPGDAGPGHVAIVVADYERRVGALRAAGVSVEERSAHWGSPRCYVRDPAGNRLELMEFAPPAS